MDEPTNAIPPGCVCWMLRELPIPEICREFRAHPELTIHNEPECADCTRRFATSTCSGTRTNSCPSTNSAPAATCRAPAGSFGGLLSSVATSGRDQQRWPMLAPRRACKATKDNGEQCRATPLRDEDFCLWHSPTHEDEVAEARVLGGKRRRRERVVQGAYDLDGIRSLDGMWRLLDIAVADTLGLENGVQRNRTLVSIVSQASDLRKTGELEERLAALEEVLLERRDKGGKRR